MSDQPPSGTSGQQDPWQSQEQPQPPYGQEPYPPGQPPYGQPGSGPYPGQPPYQGQPYGPPGGPLPYPGAGYGSGPPPRRRHPLRKWLLIASAVFAGIIAAVVAIGLAVGSAANKAANPVAAESASPSALSSVESAAAACNSAGGTWNGTSCTVASTPTPTPTGPNMLTVGSSETVGDASTNATWATITVESVSVTTQPAQAYGSSPANGYFVVVQVKATADPNYTGGFPINQLDFYDLVRGHHYDPGNGNAYDALSDSQTNQDITATLGAGETSSGWIAFDVPHSHGYIVYAPNANGQPLAEWKY